MAIDFVNPLTAGTVLIRSAIQSQNYSTGSAGWIINANGSAEFSNVTLRGSNGEVLVVGPDTGIQVKVQVVSGAGAIVFDSNDSIQNGLGSGLVAGIENAGLPNKYLSFSLVGYSIAAHTQQMVMVANSQPLDGSAEANIQIYESVSDTLQFDIRPSATTCYNQFKVASNVSKSGATWQTPSYAANWAGSTSFNGTNNWGTLQYRMDAEDNLWLVGCFKATGAAGSTVFTLPSSPDYRPASQWPLACQRNNGGTLSFFSLEIGSSGNVNLLAGSGGSVVSGNEFLVNAKIPLGNIP